MSALDDIRQRAEAATQGPWEANDYVDIDADGAYDLANVTATDPDEPEVAVLGIALGILPADAEFIAHARADIPRLLGVLDAILGWHQRGRFDHCVHCKHEWPCPTVAAVNDALEAGK